MKRLTVYCASSARIRPVFFEATDRLGRLLARADVEVVFGGGSTGLMGRLADAVLAEGGRIKGIMPRFMQEEEWSHPGVTYFEFTDTMHERKAGLLTDVDGVVALPGGCGTLEELFEVLTLKRLGMFTKPVVILNTDGYYEPLKALLDNSIAEHFMSEKHRSMWTFVDEPEDVLPALRQAPEWDGDALKYARV